MVMAVQGGVVNLFRRKFTLGELALLEQIKLLEKQLEIRNDLIEQLNFEIIELREKLSRFELPNIKVEPIVYQKSSRKETP